MKARMNAIRSGFGLGSEPPVVPTDTAAFSFCDATPGSPLAVARAECNDPKCLERHVKRGLTHGAFLYELRWGVVEFKGFYLTAVAVQTRCHQCGTAHEHIQVPHALPAPLIQPT